MSGNEQNKGTSKSKKDGSSSNKPPPKKVRDDEVDDGDIATPKRDRNYEDEDL